MPRPAKGPRLYLDERPGREAYWIIRDGTQRVRTGCPARDREGAEKALGRYLAGKHEPVVAGRETTIADVLLLYAQHNSADPVPYHCRALAPFWVGKTLAEVTAANCRAYVSSRRVKPATARRELETLSAAIRFCAREMGTPVALVTYPPKSPARARWLTRQEVARLLWAAMGWGPAALDIATREPVKWARLHPPQRHLCRFILVGLYTGTRHGAILDLQWRMNPSGGWVDLDRGVLYRRGTEAVETRKRQPPVRLNAKLAAHLKRWRRIDSGIGHVISYGGEAIEKERRAWHRARMVTGLGEDVTPHVLRHTCATWLLQAGVSTWEAAGYLGMSEKVIRDVYGHHSPEFQKAAAAAF